MVYTYNYTIATNIPGGVMTINNVNYIHALCNEQITTLLLQTLVIDDGATLSLSFQSQLTGPEKTTLDNDTINPAGGLIHQAANYIEAIGALNGDGLPFTIEDFQRIPLAGDGLASMHIDLYLRLGDGTIILGRDDEISITSPGGIAPLSQSQIAFDPSTGNAQFVVLPTVSRFRGQRPLIITSNGLPSRYFIMILE